MSSTPNAEGSRVPTEVAGAVSITGTTNAVPGGWFRCDRILMGDVQIGAVHVREQHGRVSSLSQAGDEYVIGRDVEWIARRSGRLPLPPVVANNAASTSLTQRRPRP